MWPFQIHSVLYQWNKRYSHDSVNLMHRIFYFRWIQRGQRKIYSKLVRCVSFNCNVWQERDSVERKLFAEFEASLHCAYTSKWQTDTPFKVNLERCYCLHLTLTVANLNLNQINPCFTIWSSMLYTDLKPIYFFLFCCMRTASQHKAVLIFQNYRLPFQNVLNDPSI